MQSSTISNKIIGMMGNRFESISSPFDCDGDFACTSAVKNHSYTIIVIHQFLLMINILKFLMKIVH